MNRYARAFQITVWIGVLVNFGLALVALFAPDRLLLALGFDVAYPNIWPRFAAWLLMLLSLFYIPGANDINRYRANAVLSVTARLAGVVFFATVVALVGFSTRYLLFAGIDLVFAIPTGIFLALAITTQNRQQAVRALEPRAKEGTHVLDEEKVAHTR